MNEYPVVVDMAAMIPDLIGALTHVSTVVMQAGLVLYLLLSGLRRLRPPETRAFAILRIVVAALLVVPILTGAHFALSLLACAGAFTLLMLLDTGPAGRGRFRRFASGAAAGAALVVGAFSLWEREDSLALGVEILTTANSWRAHEVEWQTKADATAPKVGELAPDFELKDPEGATSVRLADFRGKRPVALIFGSYT